MNDHDWMQQALALARQAESAGEVPVGALLVRENEILASSFNQPIVKSDPCAHAEILALRNAAEKIGNYRLLNTTLYVTLEPCMMCVGAMVHARIKRLVFGAFDPKTGVARLLDEPFLNHKVEYEGGVLAKECGEILSSFFRSRR